MVALQSDIVALDLFDHGDTFKRAWPSLLRGYAMDAFPERDRASAPLSLAAARERIGELARKAVLVAHAVPGVGRYFAVSGSGIAGGVAVRPGRAGHVAVFPSAGSR